MEACEEKLLSSTREQLLHYHPIRFERITEDEIRLCNRIACGAESIQFERDDHVKNLQLYPRQPEYADEACIGIRLSINDQPCWVGLSKFFLYDHIQAYIPPENLEDLPAELRGAVMEAALDPLLSQCEQAIGTKIAIREILLQPPIKKLTNAIFFSLSPHDNAHVSGYFSFGENLLPLFIKTLQERPVKEANDWDHLPVTVRFEIGHTRLKVTALEGVLPGDLIVADVCPLAKDQSLNIRIVPDLLVEGTLKEDTVVVQRTAGGIMTDEDNSDEDDKNTVVDIDELQVNLVFDLGQKILPLREIKTIQPGYIFQLDNSVERPVTIRANGQPIGIGQLVQTGNNIGVRILELYGKSDG